MVITTTKAQENHLRPWKFTVAGSAATAMLLLTAPSSAADWEITPTLGLKETFTDNVRLSKKDEESDFITQVNPGISVVARGPRLNLNARYIMENLFYADESDRNATNHHLNASGKLELVDDHLFLDAKANISQQNISSFGPQTTDNTNITDNRTNVRTYSISPYLLGHLQDFATSEVRYTHDSVSTNGSGSAVSSGLSNSQADKILLRLTSGTDFRKLGWGLKYDQQRTDFDNGQTVDEKTYEGKLKLQIAPHFSLLATSGYEKHDFLSANNNSGAYWTAGFEWNPSRRTTIEANAGKRYFGDTYSFRANHRSRRTAWNVSYSEDVTTTRSQFLIPATVDTAGFLDELWTSIIPDPVVRQQVVTAFISENGLPESLADSVNFLTNRYFLQKRLQASFSITGRRDTGVFSLFHVKREAQTAQSSDSIFLGTSDFSSQDNIKQEGVHALWNRKIAPHTSANLSVAYTKTTSETTSREDEEKTLRIGLVKEFQPKINGAVEFRHRDLNSNQSSGTEYTENAITGSVTIKF